MLRDPFSSRSQANPQLGHWNHAADPRRELMAPQLEQVFEVYASQVRTTRTPRAAAIGNKTRSRNRPWASECMLRATDLAIVLFRVVPSALRRSRRTISDVAK